MDTAVQPLMPPPRHALREFPAPTSSQIESAVRESFQLTQANGGATYNLQDGNLAGSRQFAVAVVPERMKSVEGLPSREEIRTFVLLNLDLLTHPHYNIGSWYNKQTVKTYLDISVVIADRQEALRLARMKHQEAIYDLHSNEEIFLPAGLR